MGRFCALASTINVSLLFVGGKDCGLVPADWSLGRMAPGALAWAIELGIDQYESRRNDRNCAGPRERIIGLFGVKLLTFTTLYPNAKQPAHGIFVENRLAHLISHAPVTTQVVAPVPFVPRSSLIPSKYAQYADIPYEEKRRGMKIYHPRYFLIPKVSMSVSPFLLYMSVRSCLEKIRNSGYDFEAIDAHYFYPDGIAAILLGRRFHRPVIITARGSDVNLIPHFRLPGRMIRWAGAKADGIIAVSHSIKERLVTLGIVPDKITVLRNGVDLALFRPRSRSQVRERLGLSGTTLLSVGNLVPLKGHDLVIQSLLSLPGVTLLIVGQGPEQARLEALARRTGVKDQVRFLGHVSHDALADVYSASDVLVLASSSEGWPNVLLEAMACGTPVVASSVSGIPEVVAAPAAGELLEERTAAAIARAVQRLLARRPERNATRAYAERFGWEATTMGQLELFRRILHQDTRSAQTG